MYYRLIKQYIKNMNINVSKGFAREQRPQNAARIRSLGPHA